MLPDHPSTTPDLKDLLGPQRKVALTPKVILILIRHGVTLTLPEYIFDQHAPTPSPKQSEINHFMETALAP